MATYTTRARATARRLAPDAVAWTVGDFKSLEHVTLPLDALVLLTGANSSGKSSLIQSLLLLAQSTDDEIILNGTLVRLGDPSDVIRSGQNQLILGYTVATSRRGDKEPQEWSFELTLSAEGASLVVSGFNAAVDGEPIIEATSSRVTGQARGEVNPEGIYGDTVLRVRELGGKTAPPKTYLSFRGFYPEVFLFRRRPKQLLAALRRTYGLAAIQANPELGYYLSDEIQPWLRSKGKSGASAGAIGELRRAYENKQWNPGRYFLALSKTDLDEIFVAYSADSAPEEWVPVPITRHVDSLYFNRAVGVTSQTLGFPVDLAETARSLSVADDSLRSIRENVRYLGPLREEPQVVSATGGRNRAVPAGPKGEYTADLLSRSKNTVVSHTASDGEQYREPLPNAVSRWTTYLGVGDTVAVQDQGKLGRGLRIKVNGVERDLTTVGFGASQLLPVLTVVLAAEAGTIVLLEQPELHLHPAVQSRLADFPAMSRPDVKLIVETHSEYLITRLRLRAAEKKLRPDNITILFAEQIQGITRVRQLRLNEVGDLSSWPRGFFDTQEQEARALVAAINPKNRGRRGKRS